MQRRTAGIWRKCSQHLSLPRSRPRDLFRWREGWRPATASDKPSPTPHRAMAFVSAARGTDVSECHRATFKAAQNAAESQRGWRPCGGLCQNVQQLHAHHLENGANLRSKQRGPLPAFCRVQAHVSPRRLSQQRRRVPLTAADAPIVASPERWREDRTGPGDDWHSFPQPPAVC
jgi:hypothetical protein